MGSFCCYGFFQGFSVFVIFLFQSNTFLGNEKVRAEEERGEAKVQLKDLLQERDQLKAKVQEQSSRVDQLSQSLQEGQTAERLLEQRAKQLEVRGGRGGHPSWMHGAAQFTGIRCFLCSPPNRGRSKTWRTR